MRLAALALSLASIVPAATSPAGNLVVNGSFESIESGRPVGWRIASGARNLAEGGSSDWFVGPPGHGDDYCFRLSGRQDTAEWWMLESDPVPVTADARVRLSAWMRTRDVHREATQWTNCNVGMRFFTADGELLPADGGYPVIGTPPLLGTHDWRRVERVVRVPDRATQARVLCFLSLSGSAWFDDVALEPVEEPEWIRVETDRFAFFEQEGDRLSPAHRRANEGNLAELEAVLDITFPVRIEFYKYRDAAQVEAVTGRAGNAHVEGASRLHTIWPVDRHEIVHLLTRVVGPPESILFGEGVAVHLAGDWQGRPLDEWVRELHDAGRLPPLERLVEHASFSAIGEAVAYPVAGSFVRFLVATRGIDAFKQVYPLHGDRPSPESFARRLREVYDASLDELEAAWKGRVLSPAASRAERGGTAGR